MIGGRRIQVGLPHAAKTVDVTIEADTCQITVEPGITISAPARLAVTSGGTKHPAIRSASPASVPGWLSHPGLWLPGYLIYS